jgi:Zn finger protein HypA/HybF involved in hydrogenase expression
MTMKLQTLSLIAKPAPKRIEEEQDLIRCMDCGSAYPTVEGPAMLYALKSPCPHCGGDCELAVIDFSLEQVA